MFYQNEDEPHALSPHAVNQGRQFFKLRAQNKVELTFHVVNVCILHILQQTAFKVEMNKWIKLNFVSLKTLDLDRKMAQSINLNRNMCLQKLHRTYFMIIIIFKECI